MLEWVEIKIKELKIMIEGFLTHCEECNILIGKSGHQDWCSKKLSVEKRVKKLENAVKTLVHQIGSSCKELKKHKDLDNVTR